MEKDFSGWATKYGLKCSDGLTISKGAFQHQDKIKVPLVWQHGHNSVDNVLGHALLDHRDEGVYVDGFFNDTAQGINAKTMVEHKDIVALSIFANELKKKGSEVYHGAIREVSLVLSGANPGAFIDWLAFEHYGGDEISDTEAIIYTGIELAHADGEAASSEETKNADEEEETISEVFDSMNDKQKAVVYAMIGAALEEGKKDGAGEESDSGAENNTAEHSATSEDDKGENLMKKNVFDTDDEGQTKTGSTLTHDQLVAIVEAAKSGQYGGSLKESFLAHAVTYGIENIDYLFPDAKNITGTPDLISRRMEWVPKVINGAKHSPFSRIKTMSADITVADARAKGYIKGNLKKEEFFALAHRSTTPTTFYKKQKLDRDDIIDITDLDVVAWLKAEMRLMLDEELGRAVLIGDGRELEVEGSPNPDKIDELCIRPIAKDDEFYAHPVYVAANTAGSDLVDAILRSLTYYKGSGSPTLFTTRAIMTDMMLAKDKLGRRLYNSKADLVAALLVSDVVDVEVLEGVVDDNNLGLLGILVNMSDYTLGATRGGEVSFFDDFDIDYNQFKYLMESRCCGALTKPKCALIFWRGAGTLAIPTAPTFVAETNTLTIETVTGVDYLIDGEIVSAGAIVITEDTTVTAEAKDDYYFTPGSVLSWTFTYTEL